MAINLDKYTFLDQGGVQKLATGILGIVNNRISERIALDVNASSDDMHVASAAAVYRAIINSRHMRTKIVTGNINEQVPLADRDATTIYWQRDNIEDTKWQIYIWVVDDAENGDLNGTWINLGDSEINLDNYWSKSDQDVASMKYVLGINDIIDTVASKADQDELDELSATVTALAATVDTKANQTDLQDLSDVVASLPTFDDLDLKLDEDNIDSIPLSTVQAILDGAYAETNLFATTHTLTVNFFYPDGRTPIADTYVAQVPELNKYNVISPTIDDGVTYYPSTQTVSGTMGTSNITRDVIYDVVYDFDDPQYLLSVAYVGPDDGTFVAPATHLELVSENAPYSVTSPTVEGYTPDINVVGGTMGEDHVIITVTYTANGDAGSNDSSNEEESDFNFDDDSGTDDQGSAGGETPGSGTVIDGDGPVDDDL